MFLWPLHSSSLLSISSTDLTFSFKSFTFVSMYAVLPLGVAPVELKVQLPENTPLKVLTSFKLTSNEIEGESR